MNNISIRLLVLFMLVGATAAWAQNGSAINSLTPNADADLTLGSTNKGLLFNNVALTSTDLAAPLTAHVAGMVVYNTAANGTGATAVAPGFYYNNGASWLSFASSALLPTTAITHTTLRWNGTAWETSGALTNDGTDVTATGNVGAATSSTAGNASVGGNLAVTGTSTLTGNVAAAGNVAVTGTTTLSGALNDGTDTGVLGQVLSSTVTGVDWIDSAVIPVGAADNTLRWNATNNAWETSGALTNDGTNVAASGNLAVTGTSTLTGDVTAAGNVAVTGKVTAGIDLELDGTLTDVAGSTGTANQVLSAGAAGDVPTWIDLPGPIVETLTATAAPTNSNVTLLILQPAADMTVTLPDAAARTAGDEIRIKRNQGYTGSGDAITLQGSSGQTIDGVATKTMNNAYQALTVVNTGTNWVLFD